MREAGRQRESIFLVIKETLEIDSQSYPLPSPSAEAGVQKTTPDVVFAADTGFRLSPE